MVSQPWNINQIEKRAYARVPVDFYFNISCVESEIERPTDAEVSQVRAIDISASGISFISEMKLPANEDYLVRNSSPELNLSGIRFKVISRSKLPDSSNTICHCQFIDTEDIFTKNRINRYVLESVLQLA